MDAIERSDDVRPSNEVVTRTNLPQDRPDVSCFAALELREVRHTPILDRTVQIAYITGMVAMCGTALTAVIGSATMDGTAKALCIVAVMSPLCILGLAMLLARTKTDATIATKYVNRPPQP